MNDMKNVLWICLSVLLLTACGGPDYEVQGDVVVRTDWSFSFGTTCDTLEGADPATFEKVTDWLGHDSERVYFEAELVPGVDVATLEAKRYPMFCDKNDYYYEAKPLHVADRATFKTIKWSANDFWATDSHCLYYDTLRIYGVDLASLELVDGRCARDKNHVYLYGKTLAGADPATFKQMKDNPSFFCDKSHVWHYEEMLAGADPSTFEFVGTRFARDKSHVWCLIDDKLLVGADPATFEVMEETDYCRDKSHIWFRSSPMADADYATFAVDNDWFAHDKYGTFTADLRDTDDSLEGDSVEVVVEE